MSNTSKCCDNKRMSVGCIKFCGGPYVGLRAIIWRSLTRIEYTESGISDNLDPNCEEL